MPRRLVLMLLLLLSAAGPMAGRAQADGGVTARSVFALLPESIFENTPEGLDAAGKQRLLSEGRSEFWELAGETEDTMVFASLPLRDTAVALRLFRSAADGSVEAALGTLGGPICTLELWRVDAAGRAVPADTPEEPDVNEFFAEGRRMPPDVRSTVILCLGPGGLKAEPQFWTATGMAHVPLDNDVSYRWTGRKFEKQVSPRAE